MESTTILTATHKATGATLAELPIPSAKEIEKVFARSRKAQKTWANLSPRKRAKHLINLRETLLNHVDDLADLIHQENGKPHFEAMINDLLPSVELITFFANQGPKILKDRKIRIHNPILAYRKSYLSFWPIGVVAVISPWNFPFFLPFGEIVMALIAGNSVVFKPSEVTPLIGLKIAELCEEAGLPPNLLQVVVGDGKVGEEIIQQKPDKVFFTGSVETGKKVLQSASKNLTPVVLELGGKDAMVVLSDSNIDFATSAALWGSFGNSGQVCASTERLFLHEKIAEPFLKEFKEKIGKLRKSSDSKQSDLGVITHDQQKKIYEKHIEEAKKSGAEVLTGGKFYYNDKALEPTVLTGANIEKTAAHNEETFGPVVTATSFKSINEAIEKANRSRYGLLASIITDNISLGEQIAKQLEVGTVIINEVAYTAGVPETPWHGVKESGMGIKHSELGLFEFTNVRHINKPRFKFFTFFKALWWYPYSPYQYEAFRGFFELYRKSWIDKLAALPTFLWNLVKFLKTEKRL